MNDQLVELTNFINNNFRRQNNPITEDQVISKALQLLIEYHNIFNSEDSLHRQRVINLIKHAFKSKPLYHQPVLIVDTKDQKLITIFFISPKVGARFSKLLGQIEAHTGWKIEVNQTKINHTQVLTIINHLLRVHRVETIKPTTFNQQFCRYIVQPKYLQPVTTEEKLQQLFEESTGLEMEFVYTKKQLTERQRQIVIGRMMAIAEEG